jgi:uracil-DNA glycosylase
MSVNYNELLDATIQHLEALKSRGTRHVAVSAETLRQLSKPVAPSVVREPAEPPKGFGVRQSSGALENGPSTEKRQETAVLNNIQVGARSELEQSQNASALSIQSQIRKPQPSTEKAAAFAALRERVMVCVKCANLASSRKNVVFGVGNIDAQLMFVGEAPGADEDAQGEPFVGRAGELLTKIIQAMGLQRSDVYIANILKCRPDTPGQTAGNRKPTPEEMATCIPYLHEQIDLIQPRVLVALGATAIEGLLGKTLGIMKLRGNWKTYRGTPLMPTFHPAYLLRNQAMTEKRKVWEDMLSVMEKLEMPVSEKQRNYFMRG